MKKALISLLTVLCATMAARAEYVLWFSVPNEAAVETDSGMTTVADFSADTGANAARIRVLPDDTFLDLFYEDEGSWMTAAGLNIAAINNDSTLAWQAAALDVYAQEGSTFVLELGKFDAGAFETLATAEGAYADLMSAGHISTGGVSMQVQTPWSPDFKVVPEPASGVLALCGALLLMRRRR